MEFLPTHFLHIEMEYFPKMINNVSIDTLGLTKLTQRSFDSRPYFLI